ncbi:MAG TPA: amidase family protein, partial [Pirellulaceae bacterium]|nr:amidase family protein [Pirellulaceae bacterium]
READDRQASGQPLGPLHGVPITIKECFHVAGTPATIGIGSLVGKLSTTDSPLVTRLKAAGAIVLGKTNLPQLMLMHESDNPVYGRTNNPWDLERTSGGSSGGEAAIVAAGGSPWGLANDLGGSIRLPAHFCGLCGVRPSSQRLTRRGTVSNLHGMEAIQSQPGPLTRSVDDAALLLRVLVGDAAQSAEHDVVPAPWRDPAAVELRGLRIAWWDDNGYFPYAPAIPRAVRQAVQLLREQGAIVEQLQPPKISEAMYLYTAILAADGAADAKRMLSGSAIDPRIRRLLLAGSFPNWSRPLVAAILKLTGANDQAGLVRAARRRTADGYWRLLQRLSDYRQAFLNDFSTRYDALILPPYALPAPQHGQASDLIAAAGDCFLINLLGLPSGVVPVTTVQANEETARPGSRELTARLASECERHSAGLPIGVQVAANFWREDIVLAIMQAIETGCQSTVGKLPRMAHAN